MVLKCFKWLQCVATKPAQYHKINKVGHSSQVKCKNKNSSDVCKEQTSLMNSFVPEIVV